MKRPAGPERKNHTERGTSIRTRRAKEKEKERPNRRRKIRKNPYVKMRRSVIVTAAEWAWVEVAEESEQMILIKTPLMRRKKEERDRQGGKTQIQRGIAHSEAKIKRKRAGKERMGPSKAAGQGQSGGACAAWAAL